MRAFGLPSVVVAFIASLVGAPQSVAQAIPQGDATVSLAIPE